MHNSAALPYLSPRDYLAIERGSAIRHEYINGVMYAMAGGSLPHNDIAFNLGTLIKIHLRGRGCRAYINDVRVLNKATGSYVYPDLFVLCGDPIYTDLHKDTVVNPLIIVEVLWPSTASFDRDGKFAHYKLLDTFQVYVLVSQDEPRIEKFTRIGEEWERSEYEGLDSVLTLEAIEFASPLSEIYEGVTFEISGEQ